MDSTVSNSTSARLMPPEELAMQSLTKQLYKGRLFRGIYVERCLVEPLAGYRDVVVLQRSERDLEKLLLASAAQLQLFYQRFVPNMWVGITSGGSFGNYTHTPHPGQLDTCLWTELSDLPFGEYWFSVKSLRFRDQEVQLKIKMVRPVELEPLAVPRRSLSLNRSSPAKQVAIAAAGAGAGGDEAAKESDLGLADFVAVVRQWGDGIKQTVYDFMANDVNKANVVDIIRFLGLLLVTVLGALVMAIRGFGIFSIRLLFELSRFTHTATPILLKVLDFLHKIAGGFFIILTMIWKDLMSRWQPETKQGPPPPDSRFRSIGYERMDSNQRGNRW
ncbi:hypothetical protein KR018_000781 [Drosophila ironensis]|nr:hypothetical protein KR018_000781 [Drosophila ironensis]